MFRVSAVLVIGFLLAGMSAGAHDIRSFETSEAYDIAVGADGSAVFTTGWGIGRIDPSGVMTAPPGEGSEFAWQITSGPDGNYWFTDGEPRIRRVTADGQVTSFTLPHALSESGRHHGGSRRPTLVHGAGEPIVSAA